MIDINLIREKPDWVKEQIHKLNDPSALERIDRVVALDRQRRELLTRVEALKAMGAFGANGYGEEAAVEILRVMKFYGNRSRRFSEEEGYHRGRRGHREGSQGLSTACATP